MTNFRPKAIVLAIVSVLIACIVALLNTTSQGILWERKRSGAAEQEAIASNRMVDATTFQAKNELKGTELTAVATVTAAQTEAAATLAAAAQTAKATIVAAQKQADALIKATQESVRPETVPLDHIYEPMISGPAKRMTELNAEIVQLKREIESGYYANSPVVLSDAAKAGKAILKLSREEELATLKETTRKNWSDSMGMVMGIFGEGLGGMGGLYPNGNDAKPVRRIVQEP